MSDTAAYEGWAIVELMGKRRLAGRVSEAQQYGATMLRLDVPGDGEAIVATQFYGGSALYCVTPTDEATARSVAVIGRPEPVQRWELPAAKAPRSERSDEGDGQPSAGDYDDI